MGGILERLKELFSRKLEIVIIGVENSGKTTLVNQMSLGEARMTVPTTGLNVKQFKKKGVIVKVWDIGGQLLFRLEWNLYARGADSILFVIDAADKDKLGVSKRELHLLLEDKELENIPILIVGNKTDIRGHMSERDVIQGMNLDYITTNRWAVIMTSALTGDRIPEVINWLVDHPSK